MNLFGGMPPAWVGPALAVVAVVGVPAFWCVMLAALAQGSGWAALAGRFQAEAREGERFGWASLSMPGPLGLPLSYNGCAQVVVGQAGVGLAVQALYRPYHPGMLIPWAEIESAVEVKGLATSGVMLRIKGHPRPVSVWGKAGQAVLRLRPA